MRKLCSKRVPRLLTPDQKQQRIDDSETFLSMLKRNGTDFYRRYVTMDETWIHYYTPESSQQSSEWVVFGESRPKRPKTQISAGKVMASVFWDAYEILFIDYLEKDLAPSDYWLFSDLKKHLQGKRYRKNEEAIADTEAYFEGKSSAFSKNGIERLEKRWTECVAVDEN
ncbi:histone-lysine N-methyltransferase SETMAR-like [Drosophila kikkawai]|uniref:Histone-lysine N-methyltransferase SETMAR-like n=1 Tax=Drosophila kikkawai TaxID=30033 RepID=A0ABM4GEC1_DROKI